MSNNVFFNSFLHKGNNQIWNAIQNDPIAHQYLWSKSYVSAVPYNLTDTRGVQLDNTRDRTRYHRFYPRPAVAHRIVIPATFSRYRFRVKNPEIKKIDNIHQAKSFVKNLGQKPAQAAVLPNTRNADGTINRVNTAENIKAYLASNNYTIPSMNELNDRWIWRQDTDYWWPEYQGKYNTLTEKSKAKKPIPKYNKDVPFLNTNFVKDKHKEAFMWLMAGNGLYNI